MRDKLVKEWEGMSQRLQEDMSARVAALHNYISSVDVSAKDDHVTSLMGHVTITEGSKEGKKKKDVRK